MKYNKKYLTEILETANGIDNDFDRGFFLNEFGSIPLRKVFACFFNPNIEFFRPKNLSFDTSSNKIGFAESYLFNEVDRIYIFEKSYPMDEERKKIRLIQVLESMAFEESVLLYNHMMTGKNPYKRLNKNFIKKYCDPFIFTMSLRDGKL